jgi:hypothetical protein
MRLAGRSVVVIRHLGVPSGDLGTPEVGQRRSATSLGRRPPASSGRPMCCTLNSDSRIAQQSRAHDFHRAAPRNSEPDGAPPRTPPRPPGGTAGPSNALRAHRIPAASATTDRRSVDAADPRSSGHRPDGAADVTTWARGAPPAPSRSRCAHASRTRGRGEVRATSRSPPAAAPRQVSGPDRRSPASCSAPQRPTRPAGRASGSPRSPCGRTAPRH